MAALVLAGALMSPCARAQDASAQVTLTYLAYSDAWFADDGTTFGLSLLYQVPLESAKPSQLLAVCDWLRTDTAYQSTSWSEVLQGTRANLKDVHLARAPSLAPMEDGMEAMCLSVPLTCTVRPGVAGIALYPSKLKLATAPANVKIAVAGDAEKAEATVGVPDLPAAKPAVAPGGPSLTPQRAYCIAHPKPDEFPKRYGVCVVFELSDIDVTNTARLNEYLGDARFYSWHEFGASQTEREAGGAEWVMASDIIVATAAPNCEQGNQWCALFAVDRKDEQPKGGPARDMEVYVLPPPASSPPGFALAAPGALRAGVSCTVEARTDRESADAKFVSAKLATVTGWKSTKTAVTLYDRAPIMAGRNPWISVPGEPRPAFSVSLLVKVPKDTAADLLTKIEDHFEDPANYVRPDNEGAGEWALLSTPVVSKVTAKLDKSKVEADSRGSAKASEDVYYVVLLRVRGNSMKGLLDVYPPGEKEAWQLVSSTLPTVADPAKSKVETNGFRVRFMDPDEVAAWVARPSKKDAGLFNDWMRTALAYAADGDQPAPDAETGKKVLALVERYGVKLLDPFDVSLARIWIESRTSLKDWIGAGEDAEAQNRQLNEIAALVAENCMRGQLAADGDKVLNALRAAAKADSNTVHDACDKLSKALADATENAFPGKTQNDPDLMRYIQGDAAEAIAEAAWDIYSSSECPSELHGRVDEWLGEDAQRRLSVRDSFRALTPEQVSGLALAAAAPALRIGAAEAPLDTNGFSAVDRTHQVHASKWALLLGLPENWDIEGDKDETQFQFDYTTAAEEGYPLQVINLKPNDSALRSILVDANLTKDFMADVLGAGSSSDAEDETEDASYIRAFYRNLDWRGDYWLGEGLGIEADGKFSDVTLSGYLESSWLAKDARLRYGLRGEADVRVGGRLDAARDTHFLGDRLRLRAGGFAEWQPKIGGINENVDPSFNFFVRGEFWEDFTNRATSRISMLPHWRIIAELTTDSKEDRKNIWFLRWAWGEEPPDWQVDEPWRWDRYEGDERWTVGYRARF